MKLFGLKSCDTCKKSLKTLAQAGFEVDFVDVRADGVSDADLQRFFAEFGDALVNTRSTTWRNLDELQRTSPPLRLLAEHPTLMKRPVIEGEKGLTLGWGKDVQALYS